MAIATLTFGRTGHESTRTIFGAAALARVTQDEADAALEQLFARGVNHIDTAASYGDSELRLGPWMERHRGRVFLATKTNQRTYVEARDEGLVRYIGVTGHGVEAPRMHLRSLEQFGFDSVLLPYNVVMMQNPAYAADFDALLQRCAEQDVALQTIKGITLGPWNERERTYRTWYEPLQDQGDIDRAVHWVLGREEV